MRALLAQASEIATPVPTPRTELDRFAGYVRDGATITRVTAHSVTAEGRGEHEDVSSQVMV